MTQERLLQLNLFNSPLFMRSHSVTIIILKFHFILRHDRVVTEKDTTITMHSSDCPYILYHVTPKTHLQQLAYIYLTKVCLIY